ncbi:MAG TPA: hypothetical protein DEP87_02695 [Candidatus Pacebacteria bacterium]|nr:hypothetical protein [Candidatus Paceibacterota bacterium]
MSGQRTYQKLVFTHHAWDRLRDRSVSLDLIWRTISDPSQQIALGENKTKYIRNVNDRPIHVVASWLPHEQRWLVISVWVKGESDKVPLMWQILTLPFKLLSWMGKQLWRLVTH